MEQDLIYSTNRSERKLRPHDWHSSLYQLLHPIDLISLLPSQVTSTQPREPDDLMPASQMKKLWPGGSGRAGVQSWGSPDHHTAPRPLP